MHARNMSPPESGRVSPRLLGLLAVLAVLVVIVFWVLHVPVVVEKDLRTVLAEMLDIPRDELVLNIPPRPQRYPGSIFDTTLGIPIHFVDAEDADLVRGPAYSLSARHEGLTRASGSLASPVFEQVMENERLVQIAVRLTTGRIIEMTIDRLRDHIAQVIDQGSPTEQSTAVIVRAHEATMTLQLDRRQDVTADAWASFRNGIKRVLEPGSESEAELHIAAESEDHVQLEIPQPFVIGFQTARVEDVRTAADGVKPRSTRLPESRPNSIDAVTALLSFDLDSVSTLSQTIREIGPGADAAVLQAFQEAIAREDREKQLRVIQLIRALPDPPLEAQEALEQLLSDAGTPEHVRVSAAGALLAIDPDSTLARGSASNVPHRNEVTLASASWPEFVVGDPLPDIGPDASGPTFLLHAVDVGSGLAILVEGPDFTVLYDGGSNDDRVLGPNNRLSAYLALAAPTLRRIDHLILSHPHRDHMELLADVFEDYEIGTVWDSGVINNTSGYARFVAAVSKEPGVVYRTAAREAGMHTITVSRSSLSLAHGPMIDTDEVVPLGAGEAATMKILHADGSPRGSLNDNSLVVRMDLGSVSVLFMGDAGTGSRDSWESGIAEPHSVGANLIACCAPAIDADVLVVGQHGSKSSSRAEFLDAVSAEVFIVSAGPSNYGSIVHPDMEVIAALAARGTVLRTDVEDTACGSATEKVGVDGDGRPGGCSNVRLLIGPGESIVAGTWIADEAAN